MFRWTLMFVLLFNLSLAEDSQLSLRETLECQSKVRWAFEGCSKAVLHEGPRFGGRCCLLAEFKLCIQKQFEVHSCPFVMELSKNKTLIDELLTTGLGELAVGCTETIESFQCIFLLNRIAFKACVFMAIVFLGLGIRICIASYRATKRRTEPLVNTPVLSPNNKTEMSPKSMAWTTQLSELWHYCSITGM